MEILKEMHIGVARCKRCHNYFHRDLNSAGVMAKAVKILFKSGLGMDVADTSGLYKEMANLSRY